MCIRDRLNTAIAFFTRRVADVERVVNITKYDNSLCAIRCQFLIKDRKEEYHFYIDNAEEMCIRDSAKSGHRDSAPSDLFYRKPQASLDPKQSTRQHKILEENNKIMKTPLGGLATNRKWLFHYFRGIFINFREFLSRSVSYTHLQGILAVGSRHHR